MTHVSGVVHFLYWAPVSLRAAAYQLKFPTSVCYWVSVAISNSVFVLLNGDVGWNFLAAGWHPFQCVVTCSTLQGNPNIFCSFFSSTKQTGTSWHCDSSVFCFAYLFHFWRSPWYNCTGWMGIKHKVSSFISEGMAVAIETVIAFCFFW